MGVKERRERQKEVLRQEILDAARELFVKEGYENFSMRKIAEKIEYSPTTIYLYFEDKAEMLYYVCEETFAKLLATLEALGEQTSDPVARLKNGLRAYIHFGLNYPNHYKVSFILHPEHHENAEKFCSQEFMGTKAYLHLRASVEACSQHLQVQPLDLDTATQAIWAAVHGLTSLLITHPDFPWVTREALIDQVVNTAINSLKLDR